MKTISAIPILLSVSIMLGCGSKSDDVEDTSTDTVLDSEPDGSMDVLVDTSDNVEDSIDDVPLDDAGDVIEDPFVETMDAPDDALVEVEASCTSDGDCDDGDPCTQDVCDTGAGTCTNPPVDEDGDGYTAMVSSAGDDCGGDDCDDTDADIHPGATTVCDMIDDDCSGTWSDESGADDDADTVLDETCGGTDCDDTDADIHPGATRDCGADHDCDTVVDDDSDGDGHIWDSCGGDDCDDDSSTTYAGASPVLCGSTDNDCNGQVDSDNDGDGATDALCSGGSDCDDADPDRHPGAVVYCDMVDDDCSGTWADEAGADDDGDFVLDDSCGGDDCDDTDALAYLGASEVCNDGGDQDCDSIEDGPLDPTSRLEVRSYLEYGEYGFDLAWTGSEIGLMWYQDDWDNDELKFHRLTEFGAKIGSDVQINGAWDDATAPSIVWSGSEFGIVHTGIIGTGDPQVYVTRLQPDGTKIGTSTRLVFSYRSSANDLSWSGTEYGVIWENEDTGISFARVAPDGTVLGSDEDVALLNSSDPDIVWSGSEYGVIYNDNSGDTSLWFSRLSPTGSDLGMTQIGSSSWQYTRVNPQIDWTGSEYAVVFIYTMSGYEFAHYTRLDGNGVQVGTEIRLTSWGTSIDARPSVVWSGGHVVASWTLGSELNVATLHSDGSRVATDVTLVRSLSNFGVVQTTATDNGVGILWDETNSPGTFNTIFYSHVSLCE